MANNNTNSSPVQRINKEDLQGTTDQKFESLIASINLFIQSVNAQLTALQFGVNVTGQFYSTQFTTNNNYTDALTPAENAATFTPIVYKSSLPYQAKMLQLGQIVIASQQVQYIASPVVISDWSDINGTISINMITGLQPSTTYNMLVLGL